MNRLDLKMNGGRPAKRVREGGRTYLVAPVSMIVPGVLQGSKGALLYPPEEVAKNPGAWNGVPLTIGHPYDWYGQDVSAQDTVIIKRFKIGTVRNDRWNGRQRVAEAWFDEQLTKNKSPEVYAALIEGRPMEVSTGLFTDDEATSGTAADGRSYQFVARNYRPDHLAILPNQTGACSLRDGCGLNVTVLSPNTNCGCRRSRPMSRRAKDDGLPETPDWATEYRAMASPAVADHAEKERRLFGRADDGGLDLPRYDWAEIARSQN